MNQAFHFGGGASQSTMHPIVLGLVLLACAATLLLPRRYVLIPIMVIAFLTPYGEQLKYGNVHFYSLRIVVLSGCARLVWDKSSGRSLFPSGLSPIDHAFYAWALFRGLTFVALYKTFGAVTYVVAFWIDSVGGYTLFRYLIQGEADIIRTSVTVSWIAAVLAPCMIFEHFTGHNLFSYISTTPILPWIREGTFRAQGSFTENSITAGVFGAVLLPLFFWLWKSGRERFFGIMGMIASSLIVYASLASTALLSGLGVILAICLWPLRAQMRPLRWALLVTVVLLDMVMKAPVWFLIARLDVAGHGWDRANMINLTVQHFSQWWLFGTNQNAKWGFDTWDSCNQFVAEALSGGLISVILFITLIKRGFGLIGRARRRASGKRLEWFYWSLGVGLFANILAFTGVDYMDATQDWWYVYLAIISAATVSIWAKSSEQRRSSGVARYDHLALTPAPLAVAAAAQKEQEAEWQRGRLSESLLSLRES